MVEDHDANRRLITGMISNLGHDVIAAETGERGVELARAQQFDVIMMDLALPGIDGIAAMTAIRALVGKHSAPRFVAISAHARLLDGAHLRGVGFDRVLRKPVRPDQLAAAISGVNGDIDLFTTSNDWIDTAQLDEIRKIVTEGEFTKLLDGLFLEVGQVAHLARNWLDTGDPEATEADAHRSGGLASMLGASRLAEVLYRLEDLVAGDDQNAARAVVVQLSHAIESTRRAFDCDTSAKDTVKHVISPPAPRP